MGLPPSVRSEFAELGCNLSDYETLCRVLASKACNDGLQKALVADWLYDFAVSHGHIDAHGADAMQAIVAEHFGRVFDEIAADMSPVPRPATVAQRAQAATSHLVTVRMDEVTMQSVEWVWHRRIAVGKVTALAGDGGLGKSTILFDIAARLSRGEHWPDGRGRAPVRSSVILSSEDDAADTIAPRLAAAGADMTKIHIAEMVRNERGEQRSFNLQADIEPLERRIKEIGDVGLLIVDPVTAYLGKVDSHKNADVRSVLGPLATMSARARIATICNTHFSKSEGQKANQKFVGSVAFVNLARAAIIVTPDPDDRDRRLFIPSKASLDRIGDGLAFRIEQCALANPAIGGSDIVASRIAWETEPVTISADAAIAGLSSRGGENNSAKAHRDRFPAKRVGLRPQARERNPQAGARRRPHAQSRALGARGARRAFQQGNQRSARTLDLDAARISGPRRRGDALAESDAVSLRAHTSSK